jgi:hypothetical protein
VDRRSFLGAGLTAGLALSGLARTCTAAARASGGPPGPDPAVTREPGLPGWPVFEWEQPGGFFDPGEGIMKPPPLAVYGDDTAYADVAKSLKLPPGWAGTLRDHARQVLGTPADLLRDPGRPPPGDRPYDQVRVGTDAGDYLTAHLEDWQDGDPGHAYPPQVRELYQHAMAIRRHVLNAGRRWHPVGVLLAVVALDYRPDHFRAWPSELPVPADGLYQEIRLPDGPRGLPRATTGFWPSYRLRSTRFVAATWRPLLPHEIT